MLDQIRNGSKVESNLMLIRRLVGNSEMRNERLHIRTCRLTPSTCPSLLFRGPVSLRAEQLHEEVCADDVLVGGCTLP